MNNKIKVFNFKLTNQELKTLLIAMHQIIERKCYKSSYIKNSNNRKFNKDNENIKLLTLAHKGNQKAIVNYLIFLIQNLVLFLGQQLLFTKNLQQA